MSEKPLQHANTITDKILTNVSRDQLDLPTPCASWSVRDLITHLVGNTYWFAAIANTATAPDRPDNAAPDVTGGDYLAAFRDGSQRAVSAFDTPGTMDNTLHLPWGDMPAGAFIMMASADQFVHGWDLARATGQPTDLDPELAARFLEFYRPVIPDAFRGPDPGAPFAVAVDVPPSAGPVAQLAAFLGRTP
jgi:uncharacterized protein (TIGR03086 family)